MRILITLCTYNERKNLEPLIAEIRRHAPPADLLVVDDGSPDETGELADRIASEDPRVHVIHRATKLGLGTAMLAAIEFAIRSDYDLLINLDADFSHHPQYIPALLECMARADVAIGSRYIPQGGIEGWGFARRLMSHTVNWYARLLLRLHVADSSGSFRCYRMALLRELDLTLFRAKGYAFQQEMLYRCQRVGCRLVETPIVFTDRKVGQSKVNLREVAASLAVLFRLGIDRAIGAPVTSVRGDE
jgi:dolichol-phosphate mannosyltransferase